MDSLISALCTVKLCVYISYLLTLILHICKTNVKTDLVLVLRHYRVFARLRASVNDTSLFVWSGKTLFMNSSQSFQKNDVKFNVTFVVDVILFQCAVGS